MSVGKHEWLRFSSLFAIYVNIYIKICVCIIASGLTCVWHTCLNLPKKAVQCEKISDKGFKLIYSRIMTAFDGVAVENNVEN